jgi:hypothetical protein
MKLGHEIAFGAMSQNGFLPEEFPLRGLREGLRSDKEVGQQDPPRADLVVIERVIHRMLKRDES